MVKKRNHENTSRLTAKERARAVAVEIWDEDIVSMGHADAPIKFVQGAIQAHARATLDRAKRRAR